MIWFATGCAVLLGLLAVIGITRNRFISQKAWVIAWTVISVSFAAFIASAYFLANPVMIDAALGGSLGFVLAISIHVAHHAVEEIRKAPSPGHG